MADIKVTQEDIDTLGNFIQKFSANIISSAGGQNAAQALYSKSITPEDMATIKTAGSVEASSLEGMLKAAFNYCAAILPVMQRAFGDEAVLRAIPNSPRILELCKAVGANDLADLYVKAQQLKSQSSPAKKPAAPRLG